MAKVSIIRIDLLSNRCYQRLREERVEPVQPVQHIAEHLQDANGQHLQDANGHPYPSSGLVLWYKTFSAATIRVSLHHTPVAPLYHVRRIVINCYQLNLGQIAAGSQRLFAVFVVAVSQNSVTI